MPRSVRTTPLVDQAVTATMTTIGPDGAPQTAPVWFIREGSEILLSTFEGMQKHRNVERDPRISLTIIDPDDPMSYVEFRGAVTIEPDPDKVLPDRIVVKHGLPDAKAFDRPDRRRVVMRLRPTKVLGRGVDVGAFE